MQQEEQNNKLTEELLGKIIDENQDKEFLDTASIEVQ